MGSTFSGEPDPRLFLVAMVGADRSGKTTLVEKLGPSEKSDMPVLTMATIDYIKNNRFRLYDAHEPCRRWRTFSHVPYDAIILVVDATDEIALDGVNPTAGKHNAKDQLISTLQDDALENAVLLVFANKQDLAPSLSAAQITERLELAALCRGQQQRPERAYRVQPCSAVTGEGLRQGLDWIYSQMRQRRK
eukprot:TRINITY_DN13978_c0_g1_i1.p1 TRINITY_DN13978_c0_g1~~TRINITY_DN13978_c0_g1_i1.p1  ORF type:complete len:191 (+),score=35.21 TRINITY_DN13978_c0_g1_i1:91-663(+)